jgi:predicted naringenin-chalcone synthase
MFIQGVGTAVPPHRYPQRDGWAAVQRSPYASKLSSRSLAILRKVLTGDTGIHTRHFVLSSLDEAFALDPNTLHRRFAQNAPILGEAAARKALQQADLNIAEIDALIVSTCTGYVCPGLTSYISERLDLKANAYLADLVGHGCGAALPNLTLANSLLKSGGAKRVLCICVEICSAAFYFDNDPGVLISACLFADGAGAVVVGKDRGPNLAAIEWIDSESVLNPRDRDLLRFETRDGMLRNILDKSVPVLVVEHVRQVLEILLARSGITQAELSAWIVHAGGRDVLLAVQSAFGLGPETLSYSAAVLREYGNVSSPSVIFALDEALRRNAPAGRWFFTSFGAGISCHGALLDVRR